MPDANSPVETGSPQRDHAAPVTRESGSFETALDRTLYWTLSIYIDAQSVAQRCGQRPVSKGSARRRPLKCDIFRAVQRDHLPSLALRNAIEPLFNDIADRERLGTVQDFLLAAGHDVSSDTGKPFRNLEEAAAAIRDPLPLTFFMPGQFSWTTEGHKFTCKLGSRDLPREVNLRRFWFAHSNGALSYHMAFSHYYGQYLSGERLRADAAKTQSPPRAAVEPLETYYFLSLLQKLAAPKEFSLDGSNWDQTVLRNEDLEIDPLDKLAVGLKQGSRIDSNEPTRRQRFWLFVQETLNRDASSLFARLVSRINEEPSAQPETACEPQVQDPSVDLLKQAEVELIEVPGLKLPRSRCLFHIHDKQFFDRLLPLDPVSQEPIARKRMVQDNCYQPYRDRIDELRKRGNAVHIGAAPDDSKAHYLPAGWLTTRSDYTAALAYRKPPMFAHWDPKEGSLPSDLEQRAITDIKSLEVAMRAGTCWLLRSPTEPWLPLPEPTQLDIPAFEAGRRDCLDYLFLAGFNQNIIDWLNQDTSEVLDSTDPIYPTEDDQANERFFVRYANHRAMITYVPHSRSLEIGNDYIGTCPYAFLIHVLALHNEYLAREHELYADKQINSISEAIERLRQNKVGAAVRNAEEDIAFEGIEDDINDLKAANFDDFEKHRYQNVFRYDTERKVFEALEVLRGMGRRTAALSGAIHTLEDKSRDVEQRRDQREQQRQKRREDSEERRQQTLSTWLAVIGAVSAAGVLFNVSQFLDTHTVPGWLPDGAPLADQVNYWSGNLALCVVLLGLPTLVLVPLYLWVRKQFKRSRLRRAKRSAAPPALAASRGRAPIDG